ncbi:MAG: HAD-IA family hydrolase, partial [bacterium]|nr:HAD-IA family hydrolase [bacterium]
MKYQLVIFDMDGTILYTLKDLELALNHSLEQTGYPGRTLEEVRRFVGNGIRKLIERSVPDTTSPDEVDRILAVFNEYYAKHCSDHTEVYDGILPLLRNLRAKGIKTAVVSNKADYGVQELCGQYFDGLFDYAVGEREGVRKKPAPDSVNEVLSFLQIAREAAVYVGDSEVDVRTARNAGLDCIAVDWGFRDREVLEAEGATVIVSDCAALEKLLSGDS